MAKKTVTDPKTPVTGRAPTASGALRAFSRDVEDTLGELVNLIDLLSWVQEARAMADMAQYAGIADAFRQYDVQVPECEELTRRHSDWTAKSKPFVQWR